jgi:asparagine synthase (glutamine-hydrolysing)
LLTFQSLLHGVALLPAGALVGLHGGTPTCLWRPSTIAAKHEIDDPTAAAERLRETVMLCCRAWSNHVGPLLVELSGGLDSSILLGAMAGGAEASLAAVNFTTGYCEGDERLHARAAALRHNIPLVELGADAEDLDYGPLFDAVPSAAPRLYGLDPQHEDMIIATARQLGAAAIATGQGGDALFFQLPTPLIAVDQARAGKPSLRAALVAARRAGCSVWHVLRLMLRDHWDRRPGPRDRYDQTLLAPAFRDQLAADPPAHPWLRDGAALPPAKRLQIEAIANCQLFFTPTRRGRVAPLLHPLLSQPIVEACLSIPTYVLAPDPRDRGLARDTFADLVPPSILARTGKGEASCYYNRALVGNLPLIRGWLLDGDLVRAGILDRAMLDTVLDEDHLLWADAARPPLLYASIEAWLRYWSA